MDETGSNTRAAPAARGRKAAACPRPPRRKPLPLGAAVAAAALAATAAVNLLLARKAERQRPPRGQFITVEGTRLHYIERGTGKALLLLHGNGSTVHDFVSSGLLERCAADYRVIAIDRPGFGHSPRPRGCSWTPERQADVIAAALHELQVSRAVVFGHSWGTLVALALAERHPKLVAALVLASGYYIPTPRADVAFFSLPAIPVLGDILLYTVWPIVARLTWHPLLKRLFAPDPLNEEFAAYLKPLATRPSQLRAVVQDTAAMIPAAGRLSRSYDSLRLPASIIAGGDDRIVPPSHSEALHRKMLWSHLDVVPKTGHMVHHSAGARVAAALRLAMQHE